jgi:hypothetical protein
MISFARRQARSRVPVEAPAWSSIAAAIASTTRSSTRPNGVAGRVLR